jgi:hypothetical protein
MQKQPYQFVGGPYDGKQFIVPGPTEIGLELRVYPVEPWVPGSSYLLGKDGRFRFANSDREIDQRWTARPTLEHSVAS